MLKMELVDDLNEFVRDENYLDINFEYFNLRFISNQARAGYKPCKVSKYSKHCQV